MNEAQRTTASHEKGEEYVVDVTVDSEYYQEVAIVKRNGASPHTGRGTEERLSSTGKEGGWGIQLVMQPAHPPNLNFNDLGFYVSLEIKVWRKRFGTNDDLVDGVQKLFGDYDSETFERVWQSLFKRYGQVLAGLGGNDFEVEHTKARKPQRAISLPESVPVGRDAFEKALDWWVYGNE